MKNKYKFMWLFVMFDLPVKSKKDAKEAQMFRNNLLKLGFDMFQFSVYYKPCNTLDKVNVYKNRVKKLIPECGNVSLMYITDIQFNNIEFLTRRKLIKNKEFPNQLSFF